MEHHAVLLKTPDIKTYLPPGAVRGVTQQIESIPQFGIGDAKKIIAAASRMPSGTDTHLHIVVVTSFITVEAQQALLKVVEEPPATTRFTFVVPASLQLLPTLLSRFAILDPQSGEVAVCSIDAFQSFLEANVGERITQVEVAAKEKNQSWMDDIKCGLLEYLSQNPGKYSQGQLQSLHLVATTLLTRGASNKMLLEELALTL